MLIRVRGYNDGVKEYLEEGVKNGRDYTRDELDERIILDGDLALTELVYHSIEDKGQDRYDSITLAFREGEIPEQTLRDIAQEFKSFFMLAYNDDEFNFYAEAHIPKLKQIEDKRTGEVIERKPHIHIVIPRKNMLSGNIINPVGSSYSQSEKYLEAFQEYINQKYNLSSPREHVRINPYSAADVLSRYKGDDFQSKNREFKQQLVRDVIEKNITSREGFYCLVSSFGETKIRNAGKSNEYLAVKLPGDMKFTNLKETIYQDDFLIHRKLKRPPMDKKIIQQLMTQWPQRAREIKYVSKATPSFRKLYEAATTDDKLELLSTRQTTFYQNFGGKHELRNGKRENDNQRSFTEAEGRGFDLVTPGMQGMPGSSMGVSRNPGESHRSLLLSGETRIHMGSTKPGRNPGLRHVVPGGRGHNTDKHNQFDRIPGTRSFTEQLKRHGYRLQEGQYRITIPPYALNPHKTASIEDIYTRARLLSGDGRKNTIKHHFVVLERRQMPLQPRNASFIASSFLRRHEQQLISRQHRREIRAIDNLFFSARRSIVMDPRLSKKEKHQYVSVLTFERMKAHQTILTTGVIHTEQEIKMGSADIRNLLRGKRIPDNSISAPDENGQTARVRFARIISRLNSHTDEKQSENQSRVLTAGDLYTRRAKLSQNVHYLDKKTDRTMFIDTGKTISLRKNGMTASSITVALQLAKEKFGSTLKINGTAEFKRQVVDIVAKEGMDIHFTDKAMNKMLEERKQELEMDRTGNTVEMPLTRDEFKAAFEDIEKRYQDIIERSSALTASEISKLQTPLEKELESLTEYYQETSRGDPDARLHEKSAKLSFDLVQIESNKAAAEADGRSGSGKTFDQDSYLFPEELQEGMTEEEMEALYQAMAEHDMQSPQGKMTLHQGVLLEHGAAPYKFKPDTNKPEDQRQDSYYVKIQMENGKTRTLWGVGLEDTVVAMQKGDRVKFEDLGQKHVTWEEQQKDGTTISRSGERTIWSGVVLERAHEKVRQQTTSPDSREQDGTDFS